MTSEPRDLSEMATANVLSAITIPFSLLLGGPDFLWAPVGPKGGAGVTAWLQNPYETPMTIQLDFARTGFRERGNGLRVELAPLEIAFVSIPFPLEPDSKLRLQMSGGLGPTPPQRIRPLVSGHLQLKESLLDTLSLPFEGRIGVSWTVSGGLVNNPYRKEFSIASGGSSGEFVAQRLWPQSGKPSVQLVPHSPEYTYLPRWWLNTLLLILAGALGWAVLQSSKPDRLNDALIAIATFVVIGGLVLFGLANALRAGRRIETKLDPLIES